MMRRIVAAVGLVTAASVSVTACGGDDKADPAAATVGTTAAACDLLGISISNFSNEVMRWVYPDSERAERSAQSLDYYLSMVDDSTSENRQLKGLAKKIDALTPQLKSAIDGRAGDAKIQQIVDEAKAPTDEFIGVCSRESEWKPDSLVGLRKVFDQKPLSTKAGSPSSTAPITPSTTAKPKPFEVTPPGTVVKFGQPVGLEFTRYSGGERGQVQFTVNVRDAPAEDLAKLTDETRNKAKRVVYVEATVKRAELLGPIPDMIEYEVIGTGGVKASRIVMFGEFAPCNDRNNYGDPAKFCSVYAFLEPNVQVTEVQLTRTGRQDPEQALYTWKK